MSTAQPDPALDGKGRRRRRRLPVWQETLLLLAVAVVLAVVLKSFFIESFYIPSGSMEPGLQVNDKILIEKPTTWFGHAPSRGDVVVFSDPGGWLTPAEDEEATGFRGVLSKVGLYPSGGHLVKRVIGVGGDTVKCCDAQGRVEVNGYPLDEQSYVIDGGKNLVCFAPMRTVPGQSCKHWTVHVPEGTIFVMGDNRNNSADSTVHICLPNQTDCTDNPFVPDDLVLGKVFAVVWPHQDWDWLTTPDDFSHVPAPA